MDPTLPLLDVRASDADRDAVRASLGQHARAGRLDAADVQHRLQVVDAAVGGAASMGALVHVAHRVSAARR